MRLEDKSLSVDLLLFRKKSHYMQETPEASFCALPGGKGPLSKPSRVVKYHLLPTQKNRLLRNGAGPFSPDRRWVSMLSPEPFSAFVTRVGAISIL